VSPTVHLLPSSQLLPVGLAALAEQLPVAVSQVPARWQLSLATQVFAAPAWQTPARQLSPVVHLSPSSHIAPSALAGFEQTPVAGSHVPAMWHASAGEQVIAIPGEQVPAEQLSRMVQRLPSEQVRPLVAVPQ
jgi:predicted RNA binding protein YcfA (HicA-like mRNA interferase family)